MRITRWGEYGILCCLYLAHRFNDGPIGASEIAQTQSIPIKYAQQILHRLRRGGVIKSVRGPHGGFLLSRDPTQVNIKEILYAAEGDTFELVCTSDPISHQFCSNTESCTLGAVWRDVKSAVDRVLEGASLSSMITKQYQASSEQSVVSRIGTDARYPSQSS